MGLREQLAKAGVTDFLGGCSDPVLTKPSVTIIREPIPVTETSVTKKRGRPKTGNALSAAERQRRSRAARKAK